MDEDQSLAEQQHPITNRELLKEAVEKGEIADFIQRRVVPAVVDRESLLTEKPGVVIDSEDLREMMTGVSRRGKTDLPSVTSAGVRMVGVTITGTLDLNDATGPGGAAMPGLRSSAAGSKIPSGWSAAG